MQGLKSVKAILRSEILRVKADFAAMLAFSLPLIPTCLGSQQKTMWFSSLDQLNCYVSKEHPKEEGFQYGDYVVTEEQIGNQKK